MKQWFVAQTHARAEGTARWHLERQGFATYLPRYLKRRRHARKTDWVESPLFPSYMFINLDLARARWRAICSTVGVKRLICAGDEPLAVPQQIIDDIRAREDDAGLVAVAPEPLYRAGQPVRVTAGPLIDQIGLFDCPSDRDRVFVLFDFLGRHLRVNLPVAALCAYS